MYIKLFFHFPKFRGRILGYSVFEYMFYVCYVVFLSFLFCVSQKNQSCAQKVVNHCFMISSLKCQIFPTETFKDYMHFYCLFLNFFFTFLMLFYKMCFFCFRWFKITIAMLKFKNLEESCVLNFRDFFFLFNYKRNEI